MGSIFRRKHRKKGKVYWGNMVWIQYSRGSRKIRESSGSTKEAEARKLLNLREGMVAQGVPLTQKTNTAKMNELFQDVVNDWKINKRRSVDGLERRLKLHILPFFYGKRASFISAADIRHFTLLRQEAGASNAEINRELAIVRRAFSLALQAGKLIHRPHFPMLKENNVRTSFLEREEFLALRAQIAEVVVECGCEGGSIAVLRRRDDQGAWRYWVESDEQAAVDMLDDEDRQGIQPRESSAAVTSLQEALLLFGRYPWHRLHPVVLHPDCREEALKAIEERNGGERSAQWRDQTILGIQRRQLPRH